VTALQLAQGVLCYLVLALLLSLLIRAPRNVPLRAVTVLIAAWALAYAFGRAASTRSMFLGFEPLTSRLISHVALLVGAFGLIAFFQFSALDNATARRKALWQAVPLGVATAIMTVAAVLVPAPDRVTAAALVSGNRDGPVSEPSVALLYLTVNVYMLYAFATSLLWTRRYARGAEPRLRRGLALTSLGLAGIVFSVAVFVSANVVRWAGGVMPGPLLVTARTVILFGIVTFLAGVAYPAVAMRVAALRVWWEHRQTYRRLAPLWTLLHQEFPQDALNRVPAGPWRDALRLRGVHRRYYRRVIECRDGLVRLSPYLGGDGSMAARLRAGVATRAGGDPVPVRPVRVAVPSGDSLEADVHELVALSDALASKKKGSVLDRPGGHREHGTAADHTHADGRV
jgi:hypothetical protein